MTTIANGPKHTFLQGPWHYCGICYWKSKLAKMKWQRGVLRCPECQDKKLLGEREPKIAAVLTDGKEEYVPADKLRRPDHSEAADDFII